MTHLDHPESVSRLTERPPLRRERLAVVDGLRAFAIVPVVLFHALPSLFGGGFIGVDVFFVISGFVICLRYLDDLAGRRTTFATFYLNRIRRLAPAYLTLIVVVVITALTLLYPKDLVNFAESLIGQSLYIQNFMFWQQGQYFDGALLKPLLHTWSLAVEEQFYLVFPLLILLMRRNRKWGFPVLVASAVASLAVGWVVAGLSPKTAFYLLPFRVWEFCAGILAAIVWQRGLPRMALANVGGIGALGALILSYAAFDQESAFPGAQAFLAVGGAAVVCLVQSQMGSGLRLVFANPVAQHFGRISYSWYLWHWPPIVFYAIHVGRAPTLAEGCLLIVAGYLLGLASYRFVEQRTLSSAAWRSRGRLLATAGTLSALSLVAGVTMMATDGLAARYPASARLLFEAQADRGGYRCGYVRRFTWWREQICRLNDVEGPGGVLLLGDSHSDVLKDILAERATAAGVPAYMVKQNCKLVDFGSYRGCSMQVWSEIASEVAAHRISAILAVEFWAEPPTPEVSARYKAAAARALSTGADLYLQRPTPVSASLDPQTRIAQLGTGVTIPPYAAKDHRAEQADANAVLDEVARSSSAVHVLDPSPLLCTADACAMDVGGHPIYLDPHHLNRRGARLLAPLYEGLMEDAARRRG